MTKGHSPRHIREIARKGRDLLQKLDAELWEKYAGRFIAIEVDSGDYFLGERGLDASRQGKEKYPETLFYVGRIGHRAAIKYRGHAPVQWGSR